MKKNEKLLFITQKIHENDDDLAFVPQWIDQFIKCGFEVQVICLEKRDFDDRFKVFSLGKENGNNKFKRIILFLKYVFQIKYDAVFVHMNPEYITLAGWFWRLKNKPVYLWYTHYTMHIHMRMAGLICTRMFAATPQSMPQFNRSPKKTILGHGLDIDFWISDYSDNESGKDEYEIISVHRICKSKRLELAILSLLELPDKYTLSVYGRDVDMKYAQKMKNLVVEKKLSSRVTFHGPVPMWQLKNIYPKRRLMINFAPETIDKTMIECMLFGIFPVTTKGNAEAIGLTLSPEAETPKSIANFILEGKWKKYSTEELQNIIKEKHGLKSLVKKMSNFILIGK